MRFLLPAKALLHTAVAIVTLVTWGGPAKAMHFSDAADVSCGSEQTVRQFYYEYENGLPHTVLRESFAFRGGDGPSCSINLIKLRRLIVSTGSIAKI